jgi:mRNA-degrading endonuclease RelE of RelBE toxin-antitoxin system
MRYKIEVTEEAKIDLSFFRAYERKTILATVREQLTHEPTKETRNRKKLRENPIAQWELRCGKYRIFYEVEADVVAVGVISIGWKEHNVLYIRGEEVKI